MLQLIIPIENEETGGLLDRYVRRLFQVIQQDIQYKANRKKYQVREPYILQMNFIKWNDKPPKELDLFYYITHCLCLHKGRGCYIIELDSRPLVTGSRTPVKDLVRLLEYGNEKLPAYPLISEILSYYQEHYEDEFVKVIERTMF